MYIVFCLGFTSQMLGVQPIYTSQREIYKGANNEEQVPEKHEITTSLINSPQYLNLIRTREYRRLPKYYNNYELGDTSSFFVRSTFDQSHWDKIPATLWLNTPDVAIWIESAVIGSIVSEDQITEIINQYASFLLDRTPGSIDSTKGILNIMADYFGNPPNCDGDDKLDILILDIQDTFNLNGSYVAGFFDPNDLTNRETSNHRDMIYIDLYPGIIYGNTVKIKKSASVLAHEYQHLIHSNYERDEREYIFINEGLSELAEKICGFSPRSPDKFFTHTNRGLLSWNFKDPLPDYSRASLWTQYLFEKIGFEHIKDLVQSSLTGMSEYLNLCSSFSQEPFNDLFIDWSIANLINRSDLNPYWGYFDDNRQTLSQGPNIVGNVFPITFTDQLNCLSYSFVSIPRVREAHFESCYLGQNDFITSVVTYPDNGPPSIHDRKVKTPNSIQISDRSQGVITYIVSNLSRPAYENNHDISNISLLVHGKNSGLEKIVTYDDGSADVFYQQASYLLIDSEEEIAVRFVPADTIWLKTVFIDAIFLSEVKGSDIDQFATRDLIIQIAEEDQETHNPGPFITPEIYHQFTRPLGNLKTEAIPLDAYFHNLGELIQPFYVIFKNNDDDQNYFGIGLDNSFGTSETQIFGKEEDAPSFSWMSFNKYSIGSLTLSGWNAMCHISVVPKLGYPENVEISASYSYNFNDLIVDLIPPFPIDYDKTNIIAQLPSGNFYSVNLDSNQSSLTMKLPLEIGGHYKIYTHLIDNHLTTAVDTQFTWSSPIFEDIQLDQSYPNPCNSETTVPYLIFEPGEVQVSLYNILGQEIDRSLMFPVLSGKHLYQLKFNNYATGVYFIRFEMHNKRKGKIVSKTMKIVLVK